MLILTPADYDAAWAYLNQFDELVFDTEASGLTWKDRICSVQLGRRGRYFYYPFRHLAGRNLPLGYLRDIAKRLERFTLIGHNVDFDRVMLMKEGFTRRIEHPFRCTMLDAHLLDEQAPSYKLEDLCDRYLPRHPKGTHAWAEIELERRVRARFPNAPSGKEWKTYIHRMSAEAAMTYGLEDLRNCELLDEYQLAAIARQRMENFPSERAEYQHVLTDMSLRGVRVDQGRLEERTVKLRSEVERLHASLCRKMAAARPQLGLFSDIGIANPRSTDQVKAWLADLRPFLEYYDKQKEKMVFSIDKKRLAFAMDDRVRELLEYKKLDRLLGSFCEKFPEFMDERGRLHPSFRIAFDGRRSEDSGGTVSSRLSCKYPNLQQVPPWLRELFLPEEDDDEMHQYDLSQAEIRWAADYYVKRYRDKWLARIVCSGTDVHDATAEVTRLERKLAKNYRFASQYGAGVEKLAFMSMRPLEEAQSYVDSMAKACPGERRLREDAKRYAEATGIIRLWTGLVMHMPKGEERKAQSRLIQGGIAEVIRIATVRVYKEVPEFRMCATIHDALCGSVKKDYRREVSYEVRRIMQDVPYSMIPIVADGEVGPNMGHHEKMARTRAGIPEKVLAYTTDPSLNQLEFPLPEACTRAFFGPLT